MTTDRPYVEMTFADSGIDINATSIDLLEGHITTLSVTTNPANLNITYSSSNSSVATVNNSGMITAKKAGTAIITARAVDGYGNVITDQCTVYVKVEDGPIENGIYYILNKQSDKFVDIYDQIMANGTVIHQWEAHGGATQQWRFTHIGGGYYTIQSINSGTWNFRFCCCYCSCIS